MGSEAVNGQVEWCEYRRCLVSLAEQRVGPVDGGPQGVVTLHRSPPPAREQPEPLVETSGDLPRSQGDDPGRGQLDGRRYGVQPPADLGDSRTVPGTYGSRAASFGL